MKRPFLIPAAVAVVGLLALAWWFNHGAGRSLQLRVPGTDQETQTGETGSNPVLAGKVVGGNGRPGDTAGTWPQFRGPNREAISSETNKLARSWGASAPRTLWTADVGEGYAGAAVREGRVYLMDYDRDSKHDALRCLSLADGREIWRYAYPLAVKRNHGMTRTVPAVFGGRVVAMGPKCHVVCLDAVTGELRWGLDLARQFGATVPPWYTGQCPLIDDHAVILAPGGPEALLLAVNADTGQTLWRTPNPRDWKMTHSSIMPMEFAGERMYVYCANNGVVGVSARDGTILWETADWKISLATVPSPLILDGGRIFFTGGYDAGSLMLELRKEGARFETRTLFRLGPGVFGATQHTPILLGSHLYGVRADGRFVCLDLEGKPVWTSDAGAQFGLGSFILADGMFLAINDAGLLRLIEATPEGYHLLGQAEVMKGHECWGPLALAGGRLIARDLTRLVCLDVAQP